MKSSNVKEQFTDGSDDSKKTQADILSDAYDMCHDPKTKSAERRRAGEQGFVSGLGGIIGASSLVDKGFGAINEKETAIPDDKTILGTMKSSLSAMKWAAIQNLQESQGDFNAEAFKSFTEIQGKFDANMKYVDSMYTFEFGILQYGSSILGSIILILLAYIFVGL